MRDGDTPHPRVFWEKSAQSIENKGREVGKERQESSRVRKRLEVKEIAKLRRSGSSEEGRCWDGEPVKRWSDKYSQAMIGQIIEVVNTLMEFWCLGIGHKAGRAQGREISESHDRHRSSEDPRVTSTRGAPRNLFAAYVRATRPGIVPPPPTIAIGTSSYNHRLPSVSGQPTRVKGSEASSSLHRPRFSG